MRKGGFLDGVLSCEGLEEPMLTRLNKAREGLLRKRAAISAELEEVEGALRRVQDQIAEEREKREREWPEERVDGGRGDPN